MKERNKDKRILYWEAGGKDVYTIDIPSKERSSPTVAEVKSVLEESRNRLLCS